MFVGLVIALGLCLPSPAADAQVFKPKSGKTEKKAAKSSSKKKVTSKKSSKKKKKKKSAAAERSRPDDLTPEPAASEDEVSDADKDFVKITDDDDIE